MKSKLLCAVLAAVTTVVACSGKGPSGGNSSNAAKTVNIPQAPGAAPESTIARASQAAALDDAKWMARWRQQYLAGRDQQKDQAALARAALQEVSAPDADPSDIAAKAKSLGPDPQKTFEFLRDNIGVEPYAGVLRGAHGTLMAGVGNALDRALLAQELLKVQGFTTRLMAGHLSAEQAGAMLNRYLSSSSLPKALANQVSQTDNAQVRRAIVDAAAQTTLPEQAISELVQYQQERAGRFQAQIAAEASKQFQLLSSQLTQDRRRVPVDVAALHSLLRERLLHHYWVQLRSRDGKWTDFDTAVPNAEKGVRYGTDSSVVTEIPESEYHTLSFTLVYMAVREGAHTEDVLLSGTVRSSNALFEPVQFNIQPTGGSDAIRALATLKPNQKAASLKALRRFQGFFKAGTDIKVSRAFDLEGNVFERPDAPLPVPQAGALADALAGDSQTPPQFVELRVVLQLSGPGREPEKQIRTLVRAADTHAGTFAPPLMAWEMLLQPQWVSQTWVTTSALRTLLAAESVSAKSVLTESQKAASANPPVASLRLLQMALSRQSALADALKSPSGVVAMVDEPQLTVYGFRLASVQQQGGEVRAEHFIDLVENSTQFVPVDQAASAQSYDIALKQSATDSALESGSIGIFSPGSDPGSGTHIFDAAKSSDRRFLLVNSHDADNLRDAGVSESDIEWIYDNESPSARLLVATTPGGAAAWWSVRQDGNAILRMNGGRGSAFSEEEIVKMKVAMAVFCQVEVLGTFLFEGKEEAETAEILCMFTTAAAGGMYVSEMHHAASVLLLLAESLYAGVEVGGWMRGH